ncbi:3-oxo-tetronate kinase [Microbacterium aurugineum]|uniref:3-oxo-tetronate kinase n=1 Tax=Microbacterium aurugineum TaxID=2851642 RepID=A0ABY4J494_9MICO|nr:3-oxo-tetronate kinase [Microbacterium aurugineum]UPL18921.1 four-carbon acid sugar kinase family protein [Microbacterium aurugineum]
MIGVIADDMTGATDVAAALRRAGLRTLLVLGTELDEHAGPADGIVIGLKTRSLPVEEAVAQSLAALTVLRRQGADRIYVKYCSTFDSTDEGNIGPITEAIADALRADLVVTTPAAPLHGRTVYRGHLFVGDVLLAETHMRDHPVTPMRDSSVPRLLAAQCTAPVGLLPLDVVQRDADSVREVMRRSRAEGIRHLVADAVTDADLAVLADAVDGEILVAGSAGLVGAMALRETAAGATAPTPPSGRTAIIAGSCSRRTLEQIDRFVGSGGPAHRVVAEPGDTAEELAARAVEWWEHLPSDADALLYSSTPAAERRQDVPGAGELYEQAAGLIASQLSDRGVKRLLVAGGETSGEVVRALGTTVAVVGEEVAPGAPWIHDEERDVHLVLKSGNFGEEDLFVEVAAQGRTA